MPSLTGIDLGAKVVAKLTRRLLPFLFLLYIVAYLDRINVGFAALQMKGQLGFSDEVYGLGAGIFFAGIFFFSGAEQSGAGPLRRAEVDRRDHGDVGDHFLLP